MLVAVLVGCLVFIIYSLGVEMGAHLGDYDHDAGKCPLRKTH